MSVRRGDPARPRIDKAALGGWILVCSGGPLLLAELITEREWYFLALYGEAIVGLSVMIWRLGVLAHLRNRLGEGSRPSGPRRLPRG